MHKGTINNWAIVFRGEGACVTGETCGYPEKPDGTDIVTSRVVAIDSATETVATKSGNLYTLGTVHPSYEEAFPNAKNRLFHVPGIRSFSEIISVFQGNG